MYRLIDLTQLLLNLPSNTNSVCSASLSCSMVRTVLQTRAVSTWQRASFFVPAVNVAANLAWKTRCCINPAVDLRCGSKSPRILLRPQGDGAVHCAYCVAAVSRSEDCPHIYYSRGYSNIEPQLTRLDQIITTPRLSGAPNLKPAP